MDLAKEVVATLTRRSLTVATAESLTGGGVGAALTAVPGASAVYRGGLITYARDLKAKLAGVDPELVEREGVVNELTALQLALGAQSRCDADWGIATTGVAGPAETDGEPVGTVFFGIVGPRVGMSPQPQYTERCHFEGDRASIREQSVAHCLAMLLRVL